MSELDYIRQRRKNKTSQIKDVPKIEVNTYEKTYVKKIWNLVIRIFICMIIFLGLSIAFKVNKDTKEIIQTNVFEKNFSFAYINELYNNVFGSITPTMVLNPNIQSVFQDKLTYNAVEEHNKSALLTVDKNYLVPVLEGGMVTFIGEKEGLGNTIIIQQTDNVDVWYSNVTNINVELYDYVEEKQLLAEVSGDKLFLTFKKGNEYLDYEEYLK